MVDHAFVDYDLQIGAATVRRSCHPSLLIVMTASASSKTPYRFNMLATAPPDSILGLTETFLADTNPNKMNLSVGVYKDATGQTPILRCVKEAERRLVEGEVTKGYLPISGVPEYCGQVGELIFGGNIDPSRIATLQTPGGTGGLRIAAGFIAGQLSSIRLWTPNPTWANHLPVFASEGVPMESYRYLAADRTSFDFEGMADDLQNNAKPGDAVLLHACCHNPTGVDPTPEQWADIAQILAAKRLLPVIDFAYQGFGKGLQEDASSIHAILKANAEAIICNSFSKNFGLYSERVGGLTLVAADASAATAAMSQLKKVVRCNYSNPPRHGAAIVSTILGDETLTEMWHDELAEMRTRIHQLRAQFVETMKTSGSGHDFSFLLPQNGMFSYSGLNQMQVDQLKNQHSIYIVGSGRINVAGMNEDRMGQLCSAVADVIEN
jgi:aspartate aminotransferase|tara:strand:+ start:698 stop:2008 length:1311 start_codon:yes stop_codon:yes gene_type:complete